MNVFILFYHTEEATVTKLRNMLLMVLVFLLLLPLPAKLLASCHRTTVLHGASFCVIPQSSFKNSNSNSNPFDYRTSTACCYVSVCPSEFGPHCEPPSSPQTNPNHPPHPAFPWPLVSARLGQSRDARSQRPVTLLIPPLPHMPH